MHKKLMKQILNDIDTKGLEPDVDDEAPKGAGNWYLGHCVQKQGVLYPRWGTQVKPIYGMLLDIQGVMYDENGPLPGSIDAVRRLRESGVAIKFCTNTSCYTKTGLSKKLREMGFKDIQPNELYTPAPAVRLVLEQRGLRPFIIADPEVMPEFQTLDQTNPNCVVLGDAKGGFTYDKMTKAFRILKDLEKPVLITMGLGRYYAGATGLMLDVGPFVKALEFACDIKAEVIGKPDPAYFEAALKDMDVEAEYAVMIGDDIVSDVAGAKACNMRGVLVRTGKYVPSDEPHPTIRPDGYVENLQVAADLFLRHR